MVKRWENLFEKKKINLPKNVTWETITKWETNISDEIENIKEGYIKSLTPQQALHKKLIRTLGDFPKIAVNQ